MIALSAGLLAGSLSMGTGIRKADAAAGNQNYAEALQKAIYFMRHSVRVRCQRVTGSNGVVIQACRMALM